MLLKLAAERSNVSVVFHVKWHVWVMPVDPVFRVMLLLFHILLLLVLLPLSSVLGGDVVVVVDFIVVSDAVDPLEEMWILL